MNKLITSIIAITLSSCATHIDCQDLNTIGQVIAIDSTECNEAGKYLYTIEITPDEYIHYTTNAILPLKTFVKVTTNLVIIDEL